jgi:hypothetical protein
MKDRIFVSLEGHVMYAISRSEGKVMTVIEIMDFRVIIWVGCYRWWLGY